jgi:hypothetical protein
MDKSISHFWKLTISCLNSGNQTIVGDAENSNLASRDGILLAILGTSKDPSASTDSNGNSQEIWSVSGLNVVKTEPESQEPQDLGVNFTQKLNEQPGQVTLHFTQWRKAERATFSMLVISEQAYAHMKAQFPHRDIVNGSTIIHDPSSDPPSNVSPHERFVDMLPTSERGIGNALTKVVAGLGALVLLILGFRPLYGRMTLGTKSVTLGGAILRGLVFSLIVLDIVTFLL